MASNPMIERVARAICEKACGAAVVADWDGPETTEGFREHWRGLARAAIAAMREPTEEMQRVGFLANRFSNADPCDKPTCIGRITMRADKAWTAMVDAALNEGSN
jgi:hypothetical protein